MPLTIRQVDAFTKTPFAGNPAAVCVVDSFPDEGLMQQVANEMNLSETAFVCPRPDGGWNLRWFTPTNEVDLCGHATLATSHVLFEQGLIEPGATAVFQTLSGELRVTRDAGQRLEMDFPAEPANMGFPGELIDNALNVDCLRHAANRMDALAEVDTEKTLRELKPDMTAIASLEVRGLIVTAPADDPDLDFVSRFFGPQVGVPEDPVTGSAHCCLAPWWGQRLGKTVMKARQLSARGGEVEVELKGDRVLLRGHAVTVMAAAMAV
ncbi:MAG: PhzF family phenazine biosynthesis protein [Bacteroidota bacterium]|nr:PhzF family phenazine biosynthesis protein [Bacteroidota bacterium]